MVTNDRKAPKALIEKQGKGNWKIIAEEEQKGNQLGKMCPTTPVINKAQSKTTLRPEGKSEPHILWMET